jgi:hypothetical protein
LCRYLPLEVREFSGKKPAIAFNISAMARILAVWQSSSITSLRWSSFSGVDQFAAARERLASALAERQ